MRIRHLLLIFSLLLTFFTSQAQEGCVPGGGCEVCDNGIDDNGDTYVDIGDPLCAEFYGLTFTGGTSDCSVDPPDSGIDFFALGDAPIKSSQNTVDDQSKIVVGDVDGDGIPDAIATTRWGFQLSVFATTNDQDDGKSQGEEKSTFKFSNSESIFNTTGSKITPELDVWIADIGTFDASGNWVSDTPDGLSEIFGVGSKRVASGAYVEDYFIVAFTYKSANLVPLYDAVYMSKTAPGPGAASGFNNYRPGIPGITDFDGDGKAEIYFRNRIYAAETGFLLADGGGDWISQINAAPVAANIIKSNSKLELITGTKIYDLSSVNLTNRTPGSPVAITPALDMNAGSVIKVQSPGQPAFTSAHPRIYEDVDMAGGPNPPGPAKAPTQKFNYSSTSVADVNNDGTLDVFISGAIDSPNGVTAVFYWDIVANKATAYEPIDPDDGVNWEWGTGRVNLRDLDGDGKVEANFVAGDHLFALEESGGILSEKWTSDLKDALSGIVATTVYDFENDGRPEIVVRDSKELRMHDGITGALVNTPPACESHTLTEGPIVVDVNGDGDTDICVACFTGPGVFKPEDNTQAKLGGITLFNSTSSNWLPTRKVWNQGPYFVVNIKDDLSVPFPMGDQTTIFGTGACDNGLAGPQRPLNMFLNQIPTLGPGGCPIFPAPDIAFGGIDPRDPAYDPAICPYRPDCPDYIPPTIEVVPPVCGELEITVNFNITNDGSLVITDDIPVSFWAVNPTGDSDGDGVPDFTVEPEDRLHTEILSVEDFQIGEIKNFSNIVFNSTGESFTLYIVLNDKYALTNQADLGPFLPLTLDDPDVQECKINNNIYDFPIVPQPFEVLTTATPNLQCDASDPDEAENGTVTVIVNENGAETLNYGKFGYQWYYGTDTLPANKIPAPEGTARNLIGDGDPDPGVLHGDYTVVVTNTLLGCQSLPITTTVPLEDLKPDIVLTKIRDQSICTPNEWDGRVDAEITGGPVGAVWSYQWVNENLTPYNGQINKDAIGLQKGIYILEVKLGGSDCIFSSEPMVVEGPEIPDPVAITQADATLCPIPPSTTSNGEVTAQALLSGDPQDPADFDFIWRYSDENFITNGSLLDVSDKSPTRTGLNPGYYIVKVVDKNSGCESAWDITQVGNQVQIPEITLVELAPQTSCDLANPNGRIQVDIAFSGIPQDPADFTINWFRGDNTIDSHLNTSGVNGEIAEGVDALVPYTVQVVSNQNCPISDKLQITQAKPVLLVTDISMIPNSTCDPTMGTDSFNGSLTVNEITVDGSPVTDFTGYSFKWYKGNDILTATLLPETGNVISQQEDFDYLVIVSQDNTACASPEEPETIDKIEDLPAIIITPTPQTNCTGTPNGIMSATVDVGGVPTTNGYTFEWFDGDDVTDPAVAQQSGSENQDAIELAGTPGGRAYTVRVTNNATGCSDELVEFLFDKSSKPVITLSVTDNTICDPSLGFTGKVTAVVSDTNGSADYLNDYTITWYQGKVAVAGNEVVDPDPSTPLDLEGVDGNFYTLVVQNDVLGCTSLPVFDEVKDIPPVIDIVITEQVNSTNCSGTPNGILAAAVDTGSGNTTSGYNFEWYEGVDSNPVTGTRTNTDGNDWRAIELQGGVPLRLYTIRVIEIGSGCDNTFTVGLDDLKALPIVSLTTVDNTGCVAGKYTGSITATITYKGVDVTNDPTYNFDYVWTGPTTIDGDPATINILDNIANGAYTLTVTETNLGCTSLVTPTTVKASPALITIDVVDTPSTNCQPDVDPNGRIDSDVWVDLDGDLTRDAGIEDDPLLFEYRWYVGVAPGAPGSEISTDIFADNLQGGIGRNYTLEITHKLSGCTETKTVLLDDKSELPVVTLVPANNTGCIAGKFTGSITATITYKGVDVTNDPLFNFSYTWTGPTTTDGDPLTVNVLDDINGGPYTLSVTEINLGCTSVPTPVDVINSPATISIDYIDTPSTNCQPDIDPNGRIVSDVWVDLDGDMIRTPVTEDDPALFEFRWYVGIVPDPGNEISITSTADLLQGGLGRNYNLEITHKSSGCTQFVPILLDDASAVPVVTLSSTPNSGCEAGKYTGDITATIFYKGVDVTLDPTFTFAYLWTGPSTIDADPATVNILDNVPNGAYTLSVTETMLGCTSAATPENVAYTPSKIYIEYTETPSTNCPAGSPNGRLVASAWIDDNGNMTKDFGEDDPIRFEYDWYDGAGTTLPIQVDNNDTYSGIQGGNVPMLREYTVEVKELNSGCTEILTIALDDVSELPQVTLIPAPNAGCIGGLYTGQISATITYKGVDVTNDPLFNYSYNWTGPGIVAPDGSDVDGDPLTANILEQVVNGTYTLTVTDTDRGCTSLIRSEDIAYTPPSFTIVALNIASTNCDLNPNGSLTAGVDSGPMDGIYGAGEEQLGLFDYKWYAGTGKTGMDITDVDPLKQHIASALQGGVGLPFTYTVSVTEKSTGCEKIETFTVDDRSIKPTVTLSKIDNNVCAAVPPIPYDGSVTAVITDVNGSNDYINDYTFTWTDSGGGVVDSDPSTPLVLEAIPGETYTLVIENDLGCQSLPVPIDVDNILPTFSIVSESTLSTNCDLTPGFANGSIIAGVDINADGFYQAGEEQLGLFDYQWYEGDDITGAPVTMDAIEESRGLAMQGGIGKDYTVEVTDESTGCSRTITVTLGEDKILPVVVLDKTPNKGCDPSTYDGTMTATVFYDGIDVTASGDYEFNWTSTDPGFVVPPLNTTSLDFLGGGFDYTLSVESTLLGCVSNPNTETIVDNPDPITIFLLPVTNTSCSGTPNGEIVAAIDLAPFNGIYDAGEELMANLGDYTFTWFINADKSGGVPANIGPANRIFQEDGNKVYGVEVLQTSTLCDEEKTIFLQRIITYPDISVVATDYADCNTDVLLTATVNNLGDFPVGTTIADFTFQWFRGIDAATGTPLGHENSNILTTLDGAAELPVDDYSVVATHGPSQCPSNEVTDRLDPPGTLFTIQLRNPISPASVCAGNDGIIEVEVAEAGTYSYVWYEGLPPGSPPATYYTEPMVDLTTLTLAVEANPDAFDYKLDGVSDGNYTVEVTRADGCKEFKSFYVPFNQGQAVGTTSVINIADCDVPDGGVINAEISNLALLPGPTANDDQNYTFYMFDGINPNFGIDAPKDFGTPAALGAGVSFPTNPLDPAKRLTEGNYTLIIQQNFGSNCLSQPLLVTIENWAYPPVVSLVGSISPNTSCDAGSYNGSLLINIDRHPDEQEDPPGTPFPTYTIEVTPADATVLIDGAPANPAALIPVSPPNVLIEGLGPKTYTITVTSSRSAGANCFIDKIFNVPDQPDVAEIRNLDVLPADECDPSGSATVTLIEIIDGDPAGAQPSANYDFRWYRENYNPADIVLQGIGADVLNSVTYVGTVMYPIFEPGDYFVEIIANAGVLGAACPTAPLPFTIEKTSIDPSISYITTDNTACDETNPAAVTGSITITPNNEGAPSAPGGWNYFWQTTPYDDVGYQESVPPVNFGPRPVTLNDVLGAGGGAQPFIQLLPGDYLVRVENEEVGCYIEEWINIPSTPITPSLEEINIQSFNIVMCDIGLLGSDDDGSIEILDIKINGISDPDGLGAYTFNWYKEDILGTPILIAGVNDRRLDSSDDPAGFPGPGIYWVEGVKTAAVPADGAGCTTNPIRVTVEDKSKDPTFSFTTSPNTTCSGDALSVNGSITISADANGAVNSLGAPLNGTYTFTWASGTSTVPPLNTTGAAGYTINDLAPGIYNVTVENDLNGCTVSLPPIEIESNPITPAITETFIQKDLTCMDIGGGDDNDGYIEVREIKVNGLVDGLGEYTYTWKKGTDYATAAVLGTTGPRLDSNDPDFGLPDWSVNTFWVEARKNTPSREDGTDCGTAAIPIIVEREVIKPDYASVIIENTTCEPTDLTSVNGQITVTANRNGAITSLGGAFETDWDFDWQSAPAGFNINAFDDPNDADGVQVIPDVPPGFYEAIITNNANGCAITAQFDIPDNPIFPELLVTDITIEPRLLCTPLNDGSINDGYVFVQNVQLNGANDPKGLYQFYWWDGDDTGPMNPVKDGVGDDRLDSSDPGNPGPGIYWVAVEKNIPSRQNGAGCISSPIKVEIPDDSVKPKFLADFTVNTSCDPAFADGTLYIAPDRNGAVPAFSGWTIDFTSDPSGLLGVGNALPGVNDIFTGSGLVDGKYDFTITDDITDCSVNGTLTITLNPVAPEILDAGVNITHQLGCDDAGSITITQIQTILSGMPGPPPIPPSPSPPDLVMANYQFTWYKDAVLPANVIGDNSGVMDNTKPGFMGAGSYWVEFEKINNLPLGSGAGGVGCGPSTPVNLIIKDESKNPTYTYTFQENSACDNLSNISVDGQLTITVDDNGSPIPATQWTLIWGNNPYGVGQFPGILDDQVLIPGGSNFTFPIFTNLRPGDYEATITNVDANCPTQAFFNIPDSPVSHQIQSTDFDLENQDECANDGLIRINSITTLNDAGIQIPDINIMNYDFKWYIGEDYDLALLDPAQPIHAAQGGPTNGHILNFTTYPPIAAGTYWVVATKQLGTANKGDGCETPPIKFVIEDQTEKPDYSYTTQANTTCSETDPSLVNGTIQLDALTANIQPAFLGNDWNFEWLITPYVDNPLNEDDPTDTDPRPITLDPRNNVTSSQNYSGLLPGDYKFQILYNGNQCTISGSINIPYNPISPDIVDGKYQVDNQVNCIINNLGDLNDGRIIIDFITVNGFDEPVTNFTFDWYVGEVFDPLAPIDYSDPGSAGGNIFDSTKPNFVGAGTYWLVATKDPGTTVGSGCSSPPVKFIIEDRTQDPDITFSQVSNTACDLSLANGEIRAVVRVDGNNLPAGSVFDWYVGPDTSIPFVDGVDGELDQTVASEETLKKLQPNIYTLAVRDGVTGCTWTASYEVDDFPVIPNISLDNVTVTPQDICNPSGSIVIQDSDISIGTNPGFVKDFFFIWTLDTPSGNPLDSISAVDGTSTGLPIQGPILDATIYANMAAGEYYVSITPKMGEGAGCPGPPRKVIVDDTSTVPQIVFESTPNSTCPGGMPNGTIMAITQEVDGTNTDPYIFTWTVDGNPVDPLNITDNADTSTVINAVDGDYSLTVENQNTGCSFTKGFTLILDRTLSEPNIIRVDKIDPIDCNPTARMEVIEIQLGGQPANVGDFEYRWYAGAFDPANIIRTDPSDPTSAPLATPNLENVAIGRYFVTAIELITNCESLAKEVNIVDDNIIYPEVEIFQDKPQTSCDVNNPNGQLSALAEGQFDDSNSNGDYSFTWFDEAMVQISDSSTVEDLGVGIYIVEVMNNITGCTATNSFIVEDGTELFRLQISMSTEPVTFCNINNGIVAAGIVNHNTGNWQFTWSGPNGFSMVESGNTSRLVNVEPGEYSVSAIDLSEEYCPSLVKSITVEDERVPPPIDMTINSQLTNCYVDEPNGQITATAGGSVIGYEFNWYSGISPSGSVIGTENIISQLPAGDYTVEIIDRFTKCSVSNTRTVEDNTVLPPTPQANILNNLTDCLNPDGKLEAVYEGNLNDFDFFWYDGNSASGTPANEETTYSDLDFGDYTLTVMDLKTGCISEGLTVPIKDERVYPEFTTKVINANCESSNGSIEIQFETNYGVKDIEWFDAAGFTSGAGQILTRQPAGDYSFEIITFKNCEAFGEETIGTEITNYNGISANSDGSNDGFQIDCITLFPNNNVKIFNRAGVLVYEADGYNNDDVIFDGIGLNGIYLSSQDLPDGTYFYVIDKGDGSRRVTGYLELIR